MSHDTVAAQIAIGRLVLEIGDSRGAALRESMRAERAHPRPRPAPVLLRPRLLRGLLDRRTEIGAAVSALDAGMLVEISGEPGIGKTALLRHLAHHPRASAFADGVVYLSARDDSSIDLLRRMFDAFYETDAPCQPTSAEIRRALEDKHALILLDEVRAPQAELDDVLESAPRCAFVVATRERRLWGELRSLALAGLPAEDGVALLEREVGRSFDAAERSAAERVCTAVSGNPLRIHQAAALIRERTLPIDTWSGHVTPDGLVTELMASDDDKQRRILLALSSVPGVPIELQHVSGIAELADVEALTMPLVQRGLVLTSQSHYLLADGIADRLRRSEDLKPWVNRAITYFTAWAERNRRNRESLLDACDALVRVQTQAADTKRWGEALRLGHLLETTLVLHGRWGAWEIVIDRCLAAARATGDRGLEAWALHELGTRAVCLGDTRFARRTLVQAATLREQLGEVAAAAVSRQNLEFVAPPPVRTPEPAEPARDQRRPRMDERGLSDSPLLRTAVHRPKTRSRWPERAAMLLTFALSAILGGFAYNAASGGDSFSEIASLFHTAAPDQGGGTAPAAGPAPAPGSALAGSALAGSRSAALASQSQVTTPVPAAPDARSEKANIRIFTARPGSIATARPVDLCYAVSDAVETRIEPGIGPVDAADTLTCRRVTPERTTTYELTAVGRDGERIKQHLVIVVR